MTTYSTGDGRICRAHDRACIEHLGAVVCPVGPHLIRASTAPARRSPMPLAALEDLRAQQRATLAAHASAAGRKGGPARAAALGPARCAEIAAAARAEKAGAWRVKERGILFAAEMVRAILDGRKTQTRRIVTGFDIRGPHPPGLFDVYRLKGHGSGWCGAFKPGESERSGFVLLCPYGVPGDRLWVRETWRAFDLDGPSFQVDYPDSDPKIVDLDDLPDSRRGPFIRATHKYPKWRVARFMPREASRITLELEAVRVERLQEITEADARAEGVAPFFEAFPNIGREQRLTSGERAADAEHRAAYAVLWDEINSERATWASNPYVWCLTFRRLP